MGTPIPENDLRQALTGLPKWTRKGNAMERLFEFDNFLQAMAFVNKIAEAAEAANHHPDIAISYNKVTLGLTSHDAGGITQRDVRMAGTIDQIAGDRKAA